MFLFTRGQDAEVLSIETARSGNELLKVFKRVGYDHEIGPGVYDIHSPRVPSVDELVRQIKEREEVLPRAQLWVNPDCGLKTRRWEEVRPSIENWCRQPGSPGRSEMLREKIAACRPGILTFGVTPPKSSDPEEKARLRAQATLERVAPARIDALVIYDIQDESSRNSAQRTFEYSGTRAPEDYWKNELGAAYPAILYQGRGQVPEGGAALLPGISSARVRHGLRGGELLKGERAPEA